MIGVSKIPILKPRYTCQRLKSDRLRIIDKLKNREMIYMGKDYSDVERVIDFLKWMELPFHDYWQDECNEKLSSMGIKP